MRALSTASVAAADGLAADAAIVPNTIAANLAIVLVVRLCARGGGRRPSLVGETPASFCEQAFSFDNRL
jgi:hypothetical protein